MNENGPETLKEAVLLYRDLKLCETTVIAWIWPDGILRCKKCSSADSWKYKRGDGRYCKGCRSYFSLKGGTVMHGSSLSLDKWLPAFWYVQNTGGSAAPMILASAVGISNSSAAHMIRRVKFALERGTISVLYGGINRSGPVKRARKSREAESLKVFRDALKIYADEDLANRTVAGWRWKEGAPTCPKCASLNYTVDNSRGARRRSPVYSCKECLTTYSLRAGTVMEGSKRPIGQWVATMWFATASGFEITVADIRDALGIELRRAKALYDLVQLAIERGTIEGAAPGMNPHWRRRTAGSVPKTVVAETEIRETLERTPATPREIELVDATGEQMMENFEAALKHILSVPKSVIDARLAQEAQSRKVRRDLRIKNGEMAPGRKPGPRLKASEEVAIPAVVGPVETPAEDVASLLRAASAWRRAHG